LGAISYDCKCAEKLDIGVIGVIFQLKGLVSISAFIVGGEDSAGSSINSRLWTWDFLEGPSKVGL
jgi:hypothetical protein